MSGRFLLQPIDTCTFWHQVNLKLDATKIEIFLMDLFQHVLKLHIFYCNYDGQILWYNLGRSIDAKKNVIMPLSTQCNIYQMALSNPY